MSPQALLQETSYQHGAMTDSRLLLQRVIFWLRIKAVSMHQLWDRFPKHQPVIGTKILRSKHEI